MKPCVCGTKRKPQVDVAGVGAPAWVSCKKCFRMTRAETKAEAIRMWNAAMTKEDGREL